MSRLKINQSTVIIEAMINPDRPAYLDYIVVHIGPLGMVMHDAAERKAVIAALQAADAELDAAAERKGTEAE